MIRSSLIGLGLAAVVAAPAIAQTCPNSPPVHTEDVLFYDAATKLVLEVIVPDDDCELANVGNGPPGATKILVQHVQSADPIQAAIAASGVALRLPGPSPSVAAVASPEASTSIAPSRSQQ